ncbi:MAG TPA: nuclear transport factor 2 family protein [Sulfurovum sp.]
MTQEKLTQFFENLKEETSIDDFRTIYDGQVRFKDPFNEVKGIDAVHGIFAHMYRNLDAPKFTITEYIDKIDVAYVKWEFHFSFKNDRAEEMFEGVSRLVMNEERRVVEHVDYWDAAEHMYEKMPIIGWLLRTIKRKIAKS